MQTLPLYHTTGISGFKIKRIRTAARDGKTADVDVQRIYCPDCKKMSYEHLEFLPNPRSRVTRSLAKLVVSERRESSITHVAESLGLSRQTVREIELDALERKYRHVPLADVKRIGIDEICVFHRESGGRQYVTVVRDLDSDRILNVSRGKGEDALRMFAKHADLGKAWALKEDLRSIYANAKDAVAAHALLVEWIARARASGVAALETMADTMEKNLEGVLGYWKFPGATNAKTEGFNNKIRWLVRQAYGYRDYRYFRLKVFDLPSLKPRDSDC